MLLEGRKALVRLTDKSDGETVTNLDKEINAYILHRIQEQYPEDNILSEEDDPVKKGKSDRLWVVDPIDGTVNMSRSLPFVCISIALWDDGDPIVGVVFDPVHQELFSAQEDRGAYLNGDPIHVSEESLERGVVLHGQPYNQDDAVRGWEKIAGVRRASLFDRQLGSAALMLCYVACGRAELLAIPGTRPWDDAAGVLIVREAGGVVTEFDGDDWDLDDESIVAGNPETHKHALELL